jgi:hypothetical protein
MGIHRELKWKIKPVMNQASSHKDVGAVEVHTPLIFELHRDKQSS